MGDSYSEYPGRARRLADAGASLLEAIADPHMDRVLALTELEAATAMPAAKVRMRFEPEAKTAGTIASSPEEVLSGILIEVQSANTLISAGLAINEHGQGAEPQRLDAAILQIRSTNSAVAAHMADSAILRFAPQTHPSTTREEALELYQESAKRTLDSIADGTEGVIASAFAKLKEVEPAKALQAIDNLGKSFDLVATAGRLIRQGLEQLKAAIDALSKLFGEDHLKDIKDAVRKIWEKFGGSKAVVRSLIGEPEASKRVDTFAAQAPLKSVVLDTVSRELALLEDKFQGIHKILSGLVSAVILAMGLVATLQLFGLWVAAPWLALAAGGAYAAIIGGALLAGLNYTGSHPLFSSMRGVCQIVAIPALDESVP